MSKEEYDKYKKVVDELDGYDICDEFNLGTYELKNEKKLLEIVLMYYFKNQDELQEKDKEIERLNNIIKEIRKMLYKKTLDEYDTYTANIVCDFQSDFEEIVRLNGGDDNE
jgi:hypothetical protein